MPLRILLKLLAMRCRSFRVSSHSSSRPSAKTLLMIFWTMPWMRAGVGAVVLADDAGDAFSQFLLPGQVHPVLDVGGEDEAAHGRGQLLVLVVPGHLVFHAISRLLDFADVVVVGRGRGA